MDIIRPGRMVGNTTRQINFEIDELLTVGETFIHDHAYHPTNKSQEFHLKKLFNRLSFEFKMIEKKHYTYDRTTKVLKLINNHEL